MSYQFGLTMQSRLEIMHAVETYPMKLGTYCTFPVVEIFSGTVPDAIVSDSLQCVLMATYAKIVISILGVYVTPPLGRELNDGNTGVQAGRSTRHVNSVRRSVGMSVDSRRSGAGDA